MDVMDTGPIAPAVPLPQVTAGSIIGRTFAVWGQNAVAFSLVMLFLYLPVLVAQLWLGPAPVVTAPHVSPSVMLRYPTLALGIGLLSGVLALVSTGALTRGVLQSLDGRRPAAAELLGFGFRKFWPVLVTSLDVGLRVMLWTLLLIVPGIMASCRLAVSVPARVAEPNLRSSEAVARSRRLTLGRRNALFLSMVVFWVVVSVVNAAVGVASRRGVLPFVAATALAWAVTAIGNGLFPTAAGVAYHDLRVEKEGADTSQLARIFE